MAQGRWEGRSHGGGPVSSEGDNVGEGDGREAQQT